MRDTLLVIVVCTKYMHKAWADNKSPKARFCEHHFGNEEFRSVAVSCLHLRDFKEGAARNFQQEGLWLYSTKKGYDASSSGGRLRIFFLYFFPDFSWFSFQGSTETEWKSFMIHDLEPITLTAAPTLREHMSNHFICWVTSLEPWANKLPCSCIWGWRVQKVALGFCVRHGKVGLRLRRWQGEIFFEDDERCWHCEGVDDLASKDRVFTMSKILNQVRGFWISMPTFFDKLFWLQS